MEVLLSKEMKLQLIHVCQLLDTHIALQLCTMLSNYKICDLRYLFEIDLYEVIIRCRNLKGIEKGG